MPMEKVLRDQALTKVDFHQRLRAWLANAGEAMVGPEDVPGVTSWVHIKDGSRVFALHADAKRDAVVHYLQMVTLHGDDLAWEIVPSQRGNMTAVAFGPEKLRYKPFYLYAIPV